MWDTVSHSIEFVEFRSYLLCIEANGGPVFTGLIEEVGTLAGKEGGRYRFAASTILEDAKLGDSVAVNGTCLTIVDQGPDWWEADISDETAARANLDALATGDRVNFERAMRASDRMGGHVVQGHVDAVGEVLAPVPDLRVRVPKDLIRYCVEKGSITIDGVSLTIFDVDEDSFTVAVIPHTAEVTTLGQKQPGSKVNIEVDIAAKQIEKLVQTYLDKLG
jgi:riboflavin synthase